MATPPCAYDAVIIGGGFYGAAIASYLSTNRGFKKIALVEREAALLLRASYNNQARVHNGYHYPRSFTTAYRSRINLPRFVKDWPDAVKTDFTKLYVIARRNSKVTAKQFTRFCTDIGAKITPAGPALTSLFEPRLVEAVFLVEEYAFDATRLAAWAMRELDKCDVQVSLNTRAISINVNSDKTLAVSLSKNQTDSRVIQCRYVFNCTYSGLNQFKGDFPGTKTQLKHEVTEMALMKVPAGLKDLGITMMDGPFFSLMPFPARGLHSLSHVRYTPHLHWYDDPNVDPCQKLAEYDRATRGDRMVRDAGRYLPAVLNAKQVDSLFEVKTVLVRNEGDDGRPILFEKHPELPGCFSVLGGKIDNIYDVLEKLDEEEL